MAIVYFQRAVRLDKDNHSAWILLGHEFMEQKNCNMAIEAYSKGLGESGGGCIIPYKCLFSLIVYISRMGNFTNFNFTNSYNYTYLVKYFKIYELSLYQRNS